jgi:hypothetical protein
VAGGKQDSWLAYLRSCELYDLLYIYCSWKGRYILSEVQRDLELVNRQDPSWIFQILFRA